MNIFSSSVLLALLGSSDVSLSFLTHPCPVGQVVSGASTSVESSYPFSSAVTSRKTKSRLYYYGDYDDNYLYFNNNDGGESNDGQNYLHQVSTLRGGGGGGGGGESSNDKDYAGLSSLSVTELKRLLNDRGVDYRDCLEKRDLVERVMSTRGSASSSYSSEYNSGGAGDLSHEENRVVNTFTRASPSVAYIQTSQQQMVQQGFSLKGTEVPIGSGSGFLWDDKVSASNILSISVHKSRNHSKYMLYLI